MRLLLISNGRHEGGALLEHARSAIDGCLPPGARRIAFVPYASVEESYDDYLAAAAPVLGGASGREVVGIHAVPEAERAALVRDADAVAVGGGNTFKLLATLRREGLLPAIRERVAAGAPYIGWSAGANLACPTIRTTNDMPIVDPGGLDALGLVPFQVNPHYLHDNPPAFEGETREQRIREHLELHRDVTVVGLREGTMLEVADGAIRLVGGHPCRVFAFGRAPLELDASADVSFLLTGEAPPDIALEGVPWRLVAYRGPDGAWAVVPAEIRATARFEDGRVAGSGGCNRFSGAVDVDGDRLAIGSVVSTLMACPPPAMTVEAAFFSALGEATGWAIGAGDAPVRRGPGSVEPAGGALVLRGPDGTASLRFVVEVVPSLVGTAWTATAVNNGRGGVASLVAGSSISAVFGEDGRLTGHGGCNRFFAPYTLDGANLSIGAVGSTRMACLDDGVMEQEAALFAALGRVTRFEIDGDRLQLRADDGSLQVDLREEGAAP